MSNVKMHDNEVDIDESLIRQLLSEQFPQWADLPISPVKSAGTDNAIYRLGVDKCLRLPRVPSADKDVEKEQTWLPVFASTLPLAIPVPLGNGCPNDRYPYKWSIFTWLEGNDATAESITDQNQAAVTLAEFIKSLWKIDTSNAPASRRGTPLIVQDNETRQAIKSLQGKINIEAVTALWDESLQVSNWNKPAVWTHGDLLPSNLLVKEGALCAVIDFGLMGIGDPACDLIPAWSVFSANPRQIFRSTLGVDESTWLRGRGWALSVALIILPYYEKTNPGLVAIAKRILNEILNNECL
jgi:aminoglycoside phosphotransferase (APT) family kinase protein